MNGYDTDARAVILLTACINPGGMVKTRLQDAAVRKRQYLESIEYYLAATRCKIVFCENTGCDIRDEITSPERHERLEYLTFNGNDYDKSLGKAYGESLIIRYASEHSVFMKTAEYVCKVTGRVKVININDIVACGGFGGRKIVKACFTFYGEINSVCFLAPKAWLSEAMAAAESRFLNRGGVDMEQVLYDCIAESRDMKIIDFFPQIDGICASFNVPYKELFAHYRKYEHYAVLCELYKSRGCKIDFLRAYICWLYHAVTWKLSDLIKQPHGAGRKR